ncbi:hypothetical protein BN946_scf185000.g26 [Trametes cinnabarina]|uniref:Uncharacterized protein n=1 Tax=Pycnoporus cinnabarinus TaxID=5643 RepID=A0A060S928_PYCCI|nr:hypothetical protein BN946_scf185000.g26 [Trametes cinnabarina]
MSLWMRTTSLYLVLARDGDSLSRKHSTGSASFRSADGPKLPNLVAQLTKPRLCTAGNKATAMQERGPAIGSGATVARHPGSSTSADMDRSEIKVASIKKAGKMWLTKHKTARNLYAHAFIEENDTISAQDFDRIYKALDPAVMQEYHAMHIFAQEQQELDGPDDVLTAFAALTDDERAVYWFTLLL